MKPTYEELEAELKRTQELLKYALEEIAKLKGQLNRNSKNSSQPPSSDKKGSTPPRPPKERMNRKGVARSPFPQERVDRHVQCTQENCPHCGSSSIQLSSQSSEIMQQAELPEVKAVVTEYQLQKYRCTSCGRNSIAKLPEGIPDSAFGTKLMALLATLTGVFHLAKREAIQLVKNLYDIDIGLGSISNIEERVAEALDPIYHRIHGFVLNSALSKHFDETGWRDCGKRHFVWLASCEQAAFYMIDRTRSSEAFLKLAGKDLKGLSAVTDRYAVYNAIEGTHQYCLAHLIREFRRYAERDGPDKEIGEALENELGTVCHIHKEYREGQTTWERRNGRLGRCKRKVETWLEDGMANGSHELYKICESLLESFGKLWAFMKVRGMEPTNNLAERDLRKLVVWRKKSYGTRSDRGKKFVERITTVSQTVKRQGKNLLSFVEDVLRSFYGKGKAPFVTEALGF